jgi:hypothetical protein
VDIVYSLLEWVHGDLCKLTKKVSDIVRVALNLPVKGRRSLEPGDDRWMMVFMYADIRGWDGSYAVGSVFRC